MIALVIFPESDNNTIVDIGPNISTDADRVPGVPIEKYYQKENVFPHCLDRINFPSLYPLYHFPPKQTSSVTVTTKPAHSGKPDTTSS
jgi:hypothetical protein